MPTKNAFISHKWIVFYRMLFVPFVPLINSQQRMKSAQWKGGGSLVVADGEQSISLAVCEASQGEKLKMFGWRYPVIPVVCLILFVGYAIRCFAFPVFWWDWKKSSSHCFAWGGCQHERFQCFSCRTAVEGVVGSRIWRCTTFAIRSCRDAKRVVKKGGILSDERCRSWSENEPLDFLQRLAKGAVWATFSCYMLRYFFMR